MNSKLRPAAIAGGILLLVAVVTVLVPVKFFNTLCCIWAIIGGALAVHLYNRRASAPARPSDGAALGALAGAIGGLPFVVILPAIGFARRQVLQALLEKQMQQMGYSQQMPMSVVAIMLITGVMFALFIIALSTVGGLIGASLFGKGGTGSGATPPPTPPIPPPDFSNPTGT